MTFSMPASNLYAYSLCESSISILGLFLACAKACWLQGGESAPPISRGRALSRLALSRPHGASAGP
jgi:hypothetical protein